MNHEDLDFLAETLVIKHPKVTTIDTLDADEKQFERKELVTVSPQVPQVLRTRRIQDLLRDEVRVSKEQGLA